MNKYLSDEKKKLIPFHRTFLRNASILLNISKQRKIYLYIFVKIFECFIAPFQSRFQMNEEKKETKHRN